MNPSKLRIQLAIFFLFMVTGNSHAFLDHWNSGRGGKPSRDGLTWERGPTTNALLWEGGGYSIGGLAPVLEGDIVVMTRVKDVTDDHAVTQAAGVIFAHDLNTGQVLWTNSLPVDFPNTDWFSSVIGMRNKKVYATRTGNANAGFLYALDALTGSLLWKSQDTIYISGVESPSFAPNGDLIIGSYNRLMRVNAKDGTRVWSIPRVGTAWGGGEPAVFGKRIYIETSLGHGPVVAAYDLDTGAYRSSSPALGDYFPQCGLFVGPDGTVYTPMNKDTTNCLIALRDTGTALVEQWRVPLGEVVFASFGVGPDGSVYSYSPDNRVIRIRPDDGTIINSSEVLPSDYFHPRMAIDSSGILFVGNGGVNQGALFSLNPDLTMRWSVPIQHLNSGGPAIGKNGTLLICGNGTNVRAYRGNSYGLPGPPVQSSREGADLVLTYSGILEAADSLTESWSEVPGAESPWLVPPTGTNQFFRSRQE